MALSFYCLGFLDLSGELEAKSKDWEREQWKEWIWSQQTRELTVASAYAYFFGITDCNH
jgi:hypothetical protein